MRSQLATVKKPNLIADLQTVVYEVPLGCCLNEMEIKMKALLYIGPIMKVNY